VSKVGFLRSGLILAVGNRPELREVLIRAARKGRMSWRMEDGIGSRGQVVRRRAGGNRECRSGTTTLERRGVPFPHLTQRVGVWVKEEGAESGVSVRGSGETGGRRGPEWSQFS